MEWFIEKMADLICDANIETDKDLQKLADDLHNAVERACCDYANDNGLIYDPMY